MKKIILFLACFWISFSFAQTDKKVESSFDLTQVSVVQVVTLIYTEAIKQNYVIDPEVLTDQRLVSFRFRGAQNQLKPFLVSFFRSLGYTIENRGGVDYISKTKEAEKPIDEEIFIYRPKHRDSGYLARILGPLFTGKFTQQRASSSAPQATPQLQQTGPSGPAQMQQGRAGQPLPQAVRDPLPNSVTSQIEQDADVLIFVGPAKENRMLEKLLPQVDTALGQVSVRAAIYEVSSTKNDGSAFKVLFNLLGSRLGVTINSDAATLGNSISFRAGGIDAVIAAISTDNRFRSVTQPRLRVRSGQQSRLTVGRDVPVLGAVSYQQGGQSVRSVDYRSAGTILSLTPSVREEGIDLQVNQQISNFVLTDTGVNDSPTLIKRELSTSITAQSGDLIVLGGLTESRTNDTARGVSFLPWATSKTADDSTVDVLIILQVDKI